MLIEPVPGSPRKTNSLPMAMEMSPEGHYIAVVNAGYGTAESKGEQSVAILDAKSHKLLDFPNPHTRESALQTLYSGIAFGSDAEHLYVSIASLTHPLPDGKNAVGNGILVYRCADGQVTEEKILPIPLQQLADGKRQNRMGTHALPAGEANPYPSGLTVVHGPDGDRLLIADNLSGRCGIDGRDERGRSCIASIFPPAAPFPCFASHRDGCDAGWKARICRALERV